jgi:ferritin
MVAQNVAQQATDAKTESDHMTLTYLANLQDEQMTELKNQTDILNYLKKAQKS